MNVFTVQGFFMSRLLILVCITVCSCGSVLWCACTMWTMSDYGLCTRSCGGGVRERSVVCVDLDLHPEDRCGAYNIPVTMESCNTQPCPGAQIAPTEPLPPLYSSELHSGGRGSVGARLQTLAARAQSDCDRSSFGCCVDGVTPAQGIGKAGCPEYVAEYVAPVGRHVDSALGSPARDVCSLRRDAGSCDTWKVRFYYDSATRKCTEFWYGSCQGNANNFMTMDECQRHCGGVTNARENAVVNQ